MGSEGERFHLGIAVQVIEELMSIADGQVVLRRDAVTGMVSVDPQASISRIGSRAYPPALADLAVQLRFELAQVGRRMQPRLLCSAEWPLGCSADWGTGDAGSEGWLASLWTEVCVVLAQAVDARRFGLNPDDAMAQQQAQFAEQAQAALAQTPGHPAPLEEQVQPSHETAHCWQLPRPLDAKVPDLSCASLPWWPSDCKGGL